MRTSFLFVLTFFAFSCAVFAQAAPATTVGPQGYLLGPGDVISIKALGEPSFDVEALTVDEDGKIIIPYAETPLMAKCKTERNLQDEVKKAWSKYLRKPEIYLRVTQRNSRPPVSVVGEVRDPKQLPVTRRIHLLELLSYAGGAKEANGGVIQVFRPNPPLCGEGGPDREWKLEAGGDNALAVPSRSYSLASLSQGREDSNPEIFPGDIVVVPKANPIYVVGEVIRPGEMSLPEGGLPLTQAIAMASGQTREAKMKSIKIYRRKAGTSSPEVIVANFEKIKSGAEKDVLLQPFDIVEVGKAPKSFTDYLLEFATGVPNRIPIPIRP